LTDFPKVPFQNMPLESDTQESFGKITRELTKYHPVSNMKNFDTDRCNMLPSKIVGIAGRDHKISYSF
jgi:hypothetical protein